jgi:hypothetical protein
MATDGREGFKGCGWEGKVAHNQKSFIMILAFLNDRK